MKPVGFKFWIHVPSERAAGLPGIDDVITITVDSGDPGGVLGEFEEFMRESLAEWYDTDVRYVTPYKPGREPWLRYGVDEEE